MRVQAREQERRLREAEAVAREEGAAELVVRGEAARGALLHKEERHVGLVVLLARAAHRRELGHEVAQEVLLRAALAVAHRATQQVRLEHAEHVRQLLARALATAAAAEELQHERARRGAAEARDGRQVERRPPGHGVRGVRAGKAAAHRVHVVAGEVLQPKAEEAHAIVRVVRVRADVALEHLVQVCVAQALRRVGHLEEAADEVVERTLVAQRRQHVLERPPVRLVRLGLAVQRVLHEHEVADEVRGAEVLAGRVHGLEDELRVVAPLRHGHGHDLQAAQPLPHERDVRERVQPPLEEREVVQDPGRPLRSGSRRMLQVVDHGAERRAVALGKRELVVVVARAERVREVAAHQDLLARERQALSLVRVRVARERHQQQRDGGDALLAVDHGERRDALRRGGAVLHGDDGAREVRLLARAPARQDVVPQLEALLLSPRVRPLVDRHHVPDVHLADEPHDPAYACVHAALSLPPPRRAVPASRGVPNGLTN